ncbi:MAG: hypothetical protein JXR19_11110 [Bacteroidia bacterium]
MTNKKTKYDHELIDKISNEVQWPNIDSSLIVKLMQIASNAFHKNSVEGRLSSVLIYHQIVEEFLLNLVKLSNLYVQAEIWPNRLYLKIDDKLMFGQILKEHEKTIDFERKEELLLKCSKFNQTRIKYVHKLLKFKTNEQIISEAGKIHDDFHEITELYLEASEFFQWLLGDLKERVAWKEMKKEI